MCAVWSAEVEVFLPVLAVVVQVEERVVGQQAHGPLGVSVGGDIDPQGDAALAGAVEVAVEGGAIARSS